MSITTQTIMVQGGAGLVPRDAEFDAYVNEAYVKTGKVTFESTVDANGNKTIVRVFADQAAQTEWSTDSKVIARQQVVNTFNKANNVSVSNS